MNTHQLFHDIQNQIASLLLQYPELADDDQLRADMLEGETDLNRALAKLVDYAREAATMADAVKARRADLGERMARYERKEEAMRALIMVLMERADLPKVTLSEATLSLRTLPPSPVVDDMTLLPEDCIRIKREPDMKAIKDAIAAGRHVLGTSMTNGRPSLMIRTK